MRRMLMISVIGLMLSPALAGTAAASEGPDPSEAVRYVYQELQSIPWDDPGTNLTEELIETIEGIPEEIFALVCVMGMPVQKDSISEFESDSITMALGVTRTQAHILADLGSFRESGHTSIWSVGIFATAGHCQASSSAWEGDAMWTADDKSRPSPKSITTWWNQPRPETAIA